MIIFRRTTVLLFAFLASALTANAADSQLSEYVLNSILKPWVSKNLPDFEYIGEEPYCDRPLSWRFVRQDDPKLRNSFALDIEMEFCSKAETASRYLHANDWSIKDVPNAGRSSVEVGEESDVFDIRLTTSGQNHSSIGGWLYCRVGSCLFFIRSYSVTLEAMTDLATKIATEVPRFPDPSPSLRERGEARFLEAIKISKENEQEFRKLPEDQRIPFPLGYPPEEKTK